MIETIALYIGVGLLVSAVLADPRGVFFLVVLLLVFGTGLTGLGMFVIGGLAEDEATLALGFWMMASPVVFVGLLTAIKEFVTWVKQYRSALGDDHGR